MRNTCVCNINVAYKKGRQAGKQILNIKTHVKTGDSYGQNVCSNQQKKNIYYSKETRLQAKWYYKFCKHVFCDEGLRVHDKVNIST